MKYAFSLALVCLTAACGGAGGSMSSGGAGGGQPIPISELPQVAVSTAPSATMASMLNDVRSAAGAGPVSYDSRLGAAARRHANDMHANQFLSHIGSDGSELGDRLGEVGYSYLWAGENIAQGQGNEAEVLGDWQGSTGHRRNNENSRAEHFGLAKAGSGINQYWVLVLADPAISR